MFLAKSYPAHPAQSWVSLVSSELNREAVCFLRKKKYIGRSELSCELTQLSALSALFGRGGLYA